VQLDGGCDWWSASRLVRSPESLGLCLFFTELSKIVN
jgi:hypothetical protein